MKHIALHIFLLIFIFGNISANVSRAEDGRSYSITNEELLENLFDKERFCNDYYYKIEAKRKQEAEKIKLLLSKKVITKSNHSSAEIESYLNEHKRLKAEAIHKLFDERLEYAIAEINKLIKKNDELIKAGRASETEYLVDLRARVNKLPFIKEDKRNEIANTLIEKNIALQKKFNDEKVRFFVLLNVFYPENNWVSYEKEGKMHYQKVETDDTDKYLKEYTEELCRKSELSSKGILLNVESVVCSKKISKKHYIKYPVYIATGSDLKNSEKRSLHEDIQFLTYINSKFLSFESPGHSPDSDPAFDHRAQVLSNFVYQLPALLLETTPSTLVDVEDYKYKVTLSHLNDEEKQQIKLILNTAAPSSQTNTFTDFRGTRLKDNAGMQEYLQKFLVSDLSAWKAQNTSARLKIITTSNIRRYHGKDARSLLTEEKLESNDFIVAMHFMEKNGDIMVHWDAKWGTKLNFIAGENFDRLWAEIKSLDKNEHFQKYFEAGIDGLDWGFSQVTAVIGAVSDVIKDNRIPEEWYKWSLTTSFFSGMINGILDDLSGTADVAKLAAQFTIASTELPYRIALFAYKYAFNENSRNAVNNTISLICSTSEHTIRSLKDFTGKLIDIGWDAGKKCLKGLSNYGSTLIQGDYKSFYQYGYGLEQIASLLLGFSEIAAIAKGAKVSTILINSATGLFYAIRGLIQGIGHFVANSISEGAKLIQKVVTELAEYGKLLADNFGSFLDDLYFASIKAYRTIFYKNPNDYGGLVLAYASEYSFRNMDQADKLPYDAFKDYLKKMSTYLGNNLDQFGKKINPSDLSNADKVESAIARALYEKNLDNINRIGNKAHFDKLSSKVPDPEKLGQILDKLLGVPMDKITGIMNNVPANKVDDLITSGLLDQIRARLNLADDLAGSSDLAKNLVKLIEEPKLVEAWDILSGSYFSKNSNSVQKVYKNLEKLGSKDDLLKEFKLISDNEIKEKWIEFLGKVDLKEVDEILIKLKANYNDYVSITRFSELFYEGAAIDLHAARYKEIINDLVNNGVEINYSRNTKPWEGGYQPSSGKPGGFRINSNVDIRTLEHEYKHFLDDKINGYPGLKFYLENPNVQFQMEVNSYNLEKMIISKEISIPTAIKNRVYEAIDIFLKRESHLINR